ncbi:MAG: ABC transporter substrate-binding protein [Cellulosilyticaceae bacterium]
MKMKKVLVITVASSMLMGTVVGCGDKGKTDTPAPSTTSSSIEDKNLSGEITVLTNKTDIVDTTFQEYAKKFNEKYPDVKVSFEAIADYEGQVKIRMNTSEYGDVLLVPNGISADQYPNFFEPLGVVEELDKKYYGAQEKAYEGKVYGIPVGMNAQGMVYNKTVFEAAGIKEIPKTPKDFLQAMKQIKEKTEAVPYYTNYAAGWPLAQWEGSTRSIEGNANFLTDLSKEEAPFSEGKAHYEVYKLMYDLAKENLVEKDPFTSDWEMSKQMMADGKIATMTLGSWAINQVKALAKNPEDIEYMPFPYTAKDGKMYNLLTGDYALAVNSNSKNKEAAKAWIQFFLDESGYAQSEGIIPPQKDSQLPEALGAFEKMGVKFFTANPEQQPGLIDQIDKAAEVGLWEPMFKQAMIESALGNSKASFEDIVKELNTKWAATRKEIVE